MITHVNKETRLVTGEIVFGQPDGFSYILGYYPEAFAAFRGTLYEMFDQMHPVGKLIETIPHPETQSVTIVSRVLRGAQSTWQKITDECVLTRYSISFVPDAEYGADRKEWPTKEYEGQHYPYLPKYTVVGVSYVDGPPAAKTASIVTTYYTE